jgi:hypothetical protein
MALKKKTLWAAAPIGVALGLVLALLPPRPLPEKETALTWALGYQIWSGYFERGSQAGRDVQAAVRHLKDEVFLAERADSLEALARRGGSLVRSADGRITVLFERPLTADSARGVLADAERELALYPAAGGPGMPVIVAVHTDTAKLRNNDVRSLGWRRRQYLHQSASGPVCLSEINRLLGRQSNSGRRTAWPLDRCAVYARYGARHGGAARPLALLGAGTNRYWSGNPVAERLVRAHQQGPPKPAPWEWRPTWSPPVPSAEPRGYPTPPVYWEESACLAGSDAACLAASRLGERRLSGFYWWWWDQPAGNTSLVVALLAAGDGRRFERFWQSDLPDAQALEAVYGTPAAKVVRGALMRQWVPAPHGPQITSRVISAALGWIVVALGLAVVAGKRRQARS